MVMGNGIADRSEAGGEVIELAVVAGDDLAQPGYHSASPTHGPAQPGDLGREIVELTVVARHRAGDLRQQLIDGCDIGTVGTTHATNCCGTSATRSSASRAALARSSLR